MTEAEAEVVGCARRMAAAVQRRWNSHDLKGDIQMEIRRHEIDLVDAVASLDGTRADLDEFVEENGTLRIGPGWKRDNQTTLMRLLMTAAHADPGEIEDWTDEQCQEAEVWAVSASLNASDNDDIRVPPLPAHVSWPR